MAKDSDAGIGTHANAAKDALKDKSKEEKHDAKADAHKGNWGFMSYAAFQYSRICGGC